MKQVYKAKYSRFSISRNTMAKLFIGAYIIYNTSLQNIGFFVPRLSITLLFLSAVSVVFGKGDVFHYRVCKGWNFLFLFFIITAGTGIFVSSYRSNVITQVFFLGESLFAGFLMIKASMNTKNTYFISYSIFISVLILVIYFMRGNAIAVDHGRLSVSESMNTNTLGVFVMFGAWCLVRNCVKIHSFAISAVSVMSGLAFFLYVVIQTGSRKAAIGILVIIMFWGVWYIRPKLKAGSSLQKLMGAILIFIVLGLIYSKFGAEFWEKSAVLRERLNGLRDLEGSWVIRVKLIQDAFACFLHNPLFGVGLNCYRFYSAYGLYSHNTYIEVLACTGIIGGGFFFASLWFAIKWCVMGVKDRTVKLEKRIDTYFFIVLLIIFLYICMGQICIYNQNLMIIMYLLIANAGIRQMEHKDRDIVANGGGQ